MSVNTTPTPDVNTSDNLLSEITAIYADIDFHRAQIDINKREACLLALRLSDIPDRRERVAVARSLYWNFDIPDWAIAAGLLFDNLSGDADLSHLEEATGQALRSTMRRMVGPGWQVPCSTPGCSGVHLLYSRSALKIALRKHSSYRSPYLCPECEEMKNKARPTMTAEELAAMEQERSQRREKRKAELADLKDRSALSQDELIRLYELMSAEDWERR